MHLSTTKRGKNLNTKMAAQVWVACWVDRIALRINTNSIRI